MPTTRRDARKQQLRRIALAFPIRVAHLHTVVTGIVDYGQRHGFWVFTTGGEAQDLHVQTLKRWRGDGVISALGSQVDAKAARALPIPVVNIVGTLQNAGIPRVMMDQQAIGTLAGEHLLTKGFKRFAFYGVEDAGYSVLRGAAFVTRLAREGLAATQYLSPNMLDRKRPWDDEIDSLCRWISRLPTPIAIFAVTDARARMVADACRIVGRDVPAEVGIMGVDNSRLDCELGAPKLTTIDCNWWAVGFNAAKLLDELIDGKAPPTKDQLIAPTAVLPRESTDVTIVDHPAVAKAVEFTRANLSRSFGVKALANAAGVSRRYLETAFARSLRRTPGEFVAQLRVERARELLLRKKMNLTRIAQECGFSDLRQFHRVFMRFEKMNPRRYRKINQDRLLDEPSTAAL